MFAEVESIASDLTSDAGVGKENFPYVAIYIALVNSFLEELFFRGFAFSFLKEKTGKIFAYSFSSAIFALYHVGMTGGWFNAPMALLTMIGLFVGGCIFSYLNDRLKNIYASYLVHMSANLAINFIGFILFGII